MFWILLAAIIGSTIAIVYLVWRRWIAPWRQIERLVRQIGRGEQPRTFLVEGGKEAQRVSVALENIFRRQLGLNRQIGERASGNRAIFSAMRDGLLVVDAERRITLLNAALQELFALKDDPLGASFLETLRDANVEEAISETFGRREPVQREIVIANRQLQINSVPMGKDNGDIVGAVVLFHDITELKRADEMRRDFVANVSHELRTPLSILRGYIETMRDDPKMPRAECARILEVMEQHSKRLGLLANDLLTLAQLESGTSSPQLNDVDFGQFLAGLVRDWKRKFMAKNLKVAIDLPADFSIVRADEALLREIFDNLLDNAVKYSSKHGEIHLGAQRRGSEIVLSVSDDGVGIGQEDLPRIFERFYRADKARSGELGGTGLGLSIVKHIAQLHGGRVEAESELGRGTRIRVILPVVTES
ncbi:MAG TPA: ATP-binding protein [Chthoniobacterales bacterium]|nr:ATP-binding protein [Chthoniobacterales bacterium]